MDRPKNANLTLKHFVLHHFSPFVRAVEYLHFTNCLILTACRTCHVHSSAICRAKPPIINPFCIMRPMPKKDQIEIGNLKWI